MMMKRKSIRSVSLEVLGCTPQEHIAKGVKKAVDDLLSTHPQEEMKLDFTPDSLGCIDSTNIIDEYKKRGMVPTLTASFAEEGGYLGEVIIRNLGGEWVYPSDKRWKRHIILTMIGVPPEYFLRYLFIECHIRLKGELIPVMKIAKLRLKKDSRVPSLKGAYDEIARTGKWSG